MGLWRFVLQVYAAWWNTLLQHYKLLLIVIVYNHKSKIQVDIALPAAVLSKSGLLVLCRAFCSPAKKYNNNKTERNHKKKKPWEKEGNEKENRKRNQKNTNVSQEFIRDFCQRIYSWGLMWVHGYVWHIVDWVCQPALLSTLSDRLTGSWAPGPRNCDGNTI